MTILLYIFIGFFIDQYTSITLIILAELIYIVNSLHSLIF